MEIIKENKILGEKLVINKLPSGLTTFIIKKPAYVEKQAMFCTKYGSIDSKFRVGNKTYDMPKGIAHFLEHKMFEDDKISVFNEFIKYGGDCNAYTNFTTTAYYFSCIDNFQKNLETLLTFVSRVNLTEENVEKEKGIICQEIKMYDDDPNWIVYFNMIKGLYNSHPIRNNIAGTCESVNKTTVDDLKLCFDTFYTPSNMSLIVVGDVDEKEIYNLANKIVQKKETKTFERCYGEEPNKIFNNYMEEKMGVANPIFHIGFKETDFENMHRNNIATKILLDIICGQSSQLYGELYKKGIIDSDFDYNYMGSLYFGMSIIAGNSSKPIKVSDMLIEAIEKLKESGIDEEVFNRIKNKHIGRFIKGFNSIDSICTGQADYFTRDTDFIEIFNLLNEMDLSFVQTRLEKHFSKENMVLSVVN